MSRRYGDLSDAQLRRFAEHEDSSILSDRWRLVALLDEGDRRLEDGDPNATRADVLSSDELAEYRTLELKINFRNAAV
jgi:hypothetical protein